MVSNGNHGRAIGQGFLLVTPMQMAALYMGIANRGTIYTPYLVERIQYPTGEAIETQNLRWRGDQCDIGNLGYGNKGYDRGCGR